MFDPIPSAMPAAGVAGMEEVIAKAIRRVLASGHYILGSEVAAFEQEFAEFLGAGHVIGTASGTDAIELALRTAGIGPGHAVITPSLTATATVAAIERSGATAVLADVTPGTFTLSAQSAARCLDTYRDLDFRAIIPVHLYGEPADMAALLPLACQHDLVVIEDCAQAHGASWRGQSVGTIGDFGAYSFYPTKNLGALGDAGALVTTSPDQAARARSLRQYGWIDRHHSTQPGINSRLDEIQAAILRARLPHLPSANRRRQVIAHAYHEGLAGLVTLPTPTSEMSTHVYHQYTIRIPARNALRTSLTARQIGTSILYPLPIHLQKAYQNRLPMDPHGLRESCQAADQLLCLPIYPELTDAQIASILDAIRTFFQEPHCRTRRTEN